MQASICLILAFTTFATSGNPVAAADPVEADRVELRWGSSPEDLDLYVAETGEEHYCITSKFANCRDTSLAEDMTSPGPEITTWRTNSDVNYLIAVGAVYGSQTPYLVDSQVTFMNNSGGCLPLSISFFDCQYYCS